MNTLTQTPLSPLRTGRITGSRVAAILGLSPYQSADECLRAMVREHFGAAPEFTGNAATEYGQRHEPDALAAYEKRMCVMCHSGGEIVIHPDHDFLAVTPDGCIDDDGLVECKAPYRGTYTSIADVPYYLPQVQLQLACTGREWCDFVVYDRKGNIHISAVIRDPQWLPSVMPKLVAYMDRYRAAIATPEAAAQYLADKERTDPAWREAANAYLRAKELADLADRDEQACRERLLALAPQGGQGLGVQVIRSERAGSIDYAKAIKAIAADADLEPYRKAGSVVFSIRTKESA